MLRLRPFRKNDAKYIINWTNEPEEFYKWSAGILGEFPLTEQRMIESTSGRDSDEHYFPFTAFDENGPVGFFHMRVKGDNYKLLRFGFVIIDPKKRNMGYGKQMLELGLHFAFEVYGADVVNLGVFANNEPAYKCYKSIGFEENGERIDYEIYGNTWTDIEMERRR